jgi:hypothetical protein
MPGKGWGWARDIVNNRLTAVANGIEGLRLSSTGAATFPIGATVTAGGVAVTAGGAAVTAGRLREGLSVTDYTTDAVYAIPAAAVLGGIITRDPNNVAGQTDTVPTGAALDLAFTSPGLVIGECVRCYLINTANGAEAITLGDAASGCTVVNPLQTIAQYEAVILLFRKTAADTFLCYILGA